MQFTFTWCIRPPDWRKYALPRPENFYNKAFTSQTIMVYTMLSPRIVVVSIVQGPTYLYFCNQKISLLLAASQLLLAQLRQCCFHIARDRALYQRTSRK